MLALKLLGQPHVLGVLRGGQADDYTPKERCRSSDGLKAPVESGTSPPDHAHEDRLNELGHVCTVQGGTMTTVKVPLEQSTLTAS